MVGSPGRGPGGGWRRTGAQRVKAAAAAAATTTRGRRERGGGGGGGGGPAASGRVPGRPRVKRRPPPGGLNPELPLRARIRIR